MILFKIVFLFLAAVILATLIFFFLKTRRSDLRIKKFIIYPFSIGLLTVSSYTAFLMSDDYYFAMVFMAIYLASQTWLTYSMFLFSYAYTGHIQKPKMQWVCVALGIFDSTSLFVNLFTYHSFDLIMLYFGDYREYWGITFNYFHLTHFAICYFFSALAFFFLCAESMKSSLFYKQRYIYILVFYVLILILNAIYYCLNLPIDFSILFYMVIAGFICYYSLYSFPHRLVTYILDNVNEKLDDGLIFFDKNGKYVYSNNVARNLMRDSNGRFSEEIAENYVDAWKSVHPESEKNGRDSFTLSDSEHHFTVEYQTLSSEGMTIGSFFKFVDKTNETKLYLKERYAATHDDLTKLYNRIGFFEAVDEMQHSQKKEDVKYIMVSSNIKDFKLVNEIFGEKMGDQILLRQAELIQKYSHASTIAGRIGDDKFALYMKKEYFNEKLFLNCINSMCKPIRDSKFQLKINIGIYESRLAFESPQVMCDKSQMACDQLESDYQHTFLRYDSTLMDRLLNEKKVLNEFDIALFEEQFKIYLQPQIAYSGTENERYFGTEALVRWHNPTRGILYPDSFIGILEKNGLIHKLDMYIWEKVANKLKDWKERGFNEISISVNISAKDLYYIDVYQTLTEIVSRNGISPKNMNIEITEAGFMENFENSKKLMEDLQNYGFKVEIDDFGSGYSSLNMLKEINVDVLKVGYTFLREAENQERSDKILEAIIGMAKDLGMDVLAVGVENTEQVKLLNSLGCDHFQGSLFSPPILIEEFERGYL